MAIIDRRGASVSSADPPAATTPNPGLAVKTACRAATTGVNIALSGLQTIDGIALASGDRVLVKDQADATTNGIYAASSGTWVRTADAADNSRWAHGALVLVASGTFNAASLWELTASDPITLGTSSMSFARVGRAVLSANLTLFVRTDGNDSNSGLANNSAGAFLTGQAAIDRLLKSYDLNGFSVTIQFAAGTYTGGIKCPSPFVGSKDAVTTSNVAIGSVTLLGDTTTPANVVLQTADAASVIQAAHGAILCVAGLKLTSSGGGNLLDAIYGGGLFATGKMEFGATSGVAQVFARRNSFVDLGSIAHIISGGGSVNSIRAANNSMVSAQTCTFTITGTPTFTYFAGATLISEILFNSATITGAITGGQYDIETNSVLSLAGVTLPGTTQTTATGGQVI